jgi:hypothetical protein
MHPVDKLQSKVVLRLASAFCSILALFVIGASSWLVVKERFAERDLRAAAEFLKQQASETTSEARASLLDEFLDAQKRAVLPLAIDAPRTLQKLTERLGTLSAAVDAGSEEIADLLADAGKVSSPPAPPSASFTSFRNIAHSISFVGAGARGSAPFYSFQREYEGGVYPSEHFTEIRKGQLFCGWKVEGAETPKIPGKIVQVKVGEKKSGPVFMNKQLPSFGIYRLRLIEQNTGRSETVTAPKSERDRAAAKQSGYEFNESWPGNTPTAEVTITGPDHAAQILTVRSGDEFKFLEKNYRVLSIQPGKVELLDKETDQSVVWGRKRATD